MPVHASSPVAPPTQPATALDTVLENTVQLGLAEIMKDPGWRVPVVAWLHEQTGVPKVYLHVAVRILAKLLPGAAKAAAKAGGIVSAKVLREAFIRVPGHATILAAYGRIDRRWAAQQELEAVVAGKITPSEARFAEHLPREKRVQFVTMAWLADVRDAVRPQPVLALPLEPDTDGNRFLFAAQRVPFLGRESEMDALRGFLSSAAPFAYWIVEGPGGTGKSRLALNLCLEQQGAWRAGFRRSFAQSEWNWENWEPSHPTLVIADYANEVAEELGGLIRALAARADQGKLSYPVRLLLLVRESGTEWKSRFAGTGTGRATIERVSHGPPLKVSALTDDDLWAVVGAYIPPHATWPRNAETLGRLAEIDPYRRPLFAAFAGDAIGNGRDLSGWDHEALVRSVLEREQDHWRRSGATERDANLLAFATMVGGLTPASIPAISLFPSTDADETLRYSPDRYRMMSGFPATEELAPLQPDILGELFVLEQLKPEYNGDDRAIKLVEAAWAFRPLGMFAFVSRCAADFGDHEAFSELWHSSRLTPATRQAWAAAAFNVGTIAGNAGRILDAERAYRQIVSLRSEFSGEAELQLQQGMSGANLMVLYHEAHRLVEGVALHSEILSLCEMYPDNVPLRMAGMRATLSLINIYGDFGYVGDANLLYTKLRSASKLSPDDVEIAVLRAFAASSLLIDYVGRMQIEDAEALYGELREINAVLAHVELIRNRFGHATTNLLPAYERLGRVSEAERAYGELQALAAAHPKDDLLRHQVVLAGVNMLNVYARSGHVIEAERLHHDLGFLRPTTDGISELALDLNLLTMFARAGRIADAELLYQHIRDVSACHPTEQTMLVYCMMAGLQLMHAYEIAGGCSEAVALYSELRKLRREHQGIPDLAEGQAYAALRLAQTLQADFRGRDRAPSISSLLDDVYEIQKELPIPSVDSVILDLQNLVRSGG